MLRMSRWLLRVLAVAGAMAISSCGDPYEQKIPAGERLTQKEVEKLSSHLESADRDLFLRWTARKATGEDYGGEPTAVTVRDAIVNQRKFESIQAEIQLTKRRKEEAEKAKLEELRRAEERRIQELEALADRRRLVHERIAVQFEVEPVSYRIETLFDAKGAQLGREWRFLLRLRNKSAKDVVGLSGAITIRDVFNKVLGSYEVRIEPRVKAGKSMEFIAAMTFDRNDPGHLAMLESSGLRLAFFFESLAFADGTNIDIRQLEALPAARPKVPPSRGA